MKGLFLTYLLTYGGVVLSLFDPFLGLMVYVCFAVIRPEFLWSWAIEPGNNFSRIVAGGLLAGWVVQEFLRWRRADPGRGLLGSLFTFALRPVLAAAGLLLRPTSGELGRGRPVVAALAAVWVWSALSAALAPRQDIAWAFVESLSKIILPFMIGICLIDSMARLKMLAWVIVLSQGYVAFEMNVSYFQGWNRLYEEGFGGMDNNSAAIAMVTCLGPAFFLGLYSERWWQKAAAFGCAALLGHAVLFSFSRGGMLAMVLTAGVSFLLVRKTKRHYFAMLTAVLVGLRLAGPEVRERFLTLFAGQEARDASAQSRLDLWAACWDVMKRMPVFGAGPDHWPLLAHSYGFNRGKEAHTLWLQWGVELGLPGLAFLLLFYGLCAWRLWPLARERDPAGDPWQRYLASMVIAALVGFAVSAQFVSLKLLEVPYYVALLGAGTLKLASAPAAAGQRVSYNVAAVPEPV